MREERPKTPAELLHSCRALDITVRIEDGALVVIFPPREWSEASAERAMGVLEPHKEAIAALLRDEEAAALEQATALLLGQVEL